MRRKGFKANGIHCGIRKNRTKRDLALVVSEKGGFGRRRLHHEPCKGRSSQGHKNHISNGKARAVICNSGNANTCNANGIEIAERMSDILAETLGISASDVVVASTGVIGQPLDITPIKTEFPSFLPVFRKRATSLPPRAL